MKKYATAFKNSQIKKKLRRIFRERTILRKEYHREYLVQ